MKESRLKAIIFIFMILAKFLTLLAILIEYATDGLEKSEMFSSIALIMPLFAVYITVILKDLMSNPYKEKQESKYLKTSLTLMTFIVFPIYALSIIGVIILAGSGKIAGEELQPILGIIESVFGIYVGQVVTTLFKEK
jgi:DMSO reductase anchor subunit